MPDPVDPTPVKVVPKGDGFAVVTKQGRTIDTAPTRGRADALAEQVNGTWAEAKGARRAKGAPEVTREALDGVLADIEEYAGMGVGPGLRTLPKGPKGPSLLSKFEERLHPRQRGKFTFSPLSQSDRASRHAELERQIHHLQPGERVKLEKAKGHEHLTPPVTVKRTHAGKYLVQGGGQTFKGVESQTLRPHDSPRKAARDAIKAWEDAPRAHESGPHMADRQARNEDWRRGSRDYTPGRRVRKALREVEESANELEERLLPHGSPRGTFGRLGNVHWDPSKHPRGRGGEFSRILGSLAHGGRANLPSGVSVHRHGRDAYEVEVPGEKDRVPGTLPGTATAAHHGGNPELLSRKAAATRALIAHHEVTLGERGTLAHRLASNKLVQSERERVARELRGLHKAREGVRGFVGRLTAFGHELSTDKEVPAWARWGMRLAVAVAVVPIVPGDEVLGPLIVGALMVRPSTRKHVKELWDEAKYGLPPDVDIPTSEKVERALKRSWARAQDALGHEPELDPYDEPPGAGADPFGRPDPSTHPEYWTEAERGWEPDIEESRLEAVLGELEELAVPRATPRGVSRRTTPAGRSGGRGTSGSAVAAQAAQAAKAAAVRANAGTTASKGGASGGTSTSAKTEPEEKEPEKHQSQKTAQTKDAG